MLIDCREVDTRVGKYTIATMNCPVCESDDYRTWATCLKREIEQVCTVFLPEIHELLTRYVKCKSCSVVYSRNAVIGYSPSKEVDCRIETFGGLVPEDPYRHTFNLKLIKKAYGKDNDFTLLDVGCNIGEFLEMALNSEIQAEGVEKDKRPIDKARKRIDAVIYEGDFCEISIPTKYDVVTFVEIIEHTIEPNKFIDRVQRVLNPGGMIFLTTTPNTSSLRVRLYKCEIPTIKNTLTHHVLYNHNAMSYLLKKHGFSRINFYHYEREEWSIKHAFMRLINRFGYFDNQVIVTAWKG